MARALSDAAIVIAYLRAHVFETSLYAQILNQYRIHHPGFFVLSLFSLTILLILTGFFLTGSYLSHQYAGKFREEVKLIVELRTGTTESDRDKVKAALLALEGVTVSGVEFVSKEQALDDMRRQMSDDLVLQGRDNPFADMFHFTLDAPYFNEAYINTLKDMIESWSAVSAMHHPAGMYDPVFHLLRKFQAIGAAIIVVLVFLCAMLIHHIMRLNVLAQRRQIRTMQLVGGHPSFIRKPYLRQAFQMALFAWSVSGILCLATVFFLAGLSRNALSPMDMTIGAAILLVIALGVCMVSTWVAVTRVLDQS